MYTTQSLILPIQISPGCVIVLVATSQAMVATVCLSSSQSQALVLFEISNPSGHLLGSTVVSPYVGMARKQNGGYNASISR